MSNEDAETEAFAGTKEAARWALRLLEQHSSYVAEVAEELRQRLVTCSPERAVWILLGLVNLTGRVGVHSPDVATLKMLLRDAARGRFDDDIRAAQTPPCR